MKRKLLALLSLVLIVCFLAACTSPVAPDPNQPTEESGTTGSADGGGNTSDTEANPDAKLISGFSDDGSYARSLNVYDSFEYDISNDGIKDKIVLYTDARKDQNGGWTFSDKGQVFALVAQVGASSYALFDKRFVSEGNVSYNLFKAKDETVHILVTCREGSQIEINDFVYAAKGNAFNKTPVYFSDSIDSIHAA